MGERLGNQRHEAFTSFPTSNPTTSLPTISGLNLKVYEALSY